MRLPAAVAIGLTLWAGGAPAAGGASGRRAIPLVWETPVVTLRVAARTGVAGDRRTLAESAVREAAAAWRSACTRAEVRLGEPENARVGAERDGVNTLSFLSDSWCRAGQPRYGCYPRAELAVTTVYLAPKAAADRDRRPRSIAELDIEVNAVDYDWFGDAPAKRRPPVDLATLLSHELGHALGLDHRTGAGTIMSAAAHHGATTTMNRPSANDLRALCRMYPAAGIAARRFPP